ncbi:hypothetical protein [Bilophila wadsworthia]|uniref:hypothetical protein n=1 Tax=Bilophila wadsworthia TaxID=35833 RepID=UPI0024309B2F|nr:hypothetical protein [Bilophila wadsworthia]
MPTRLNIPNQALDRADGTFPHIAHDRCAARFMSVAMVPPLVAAVLAMVAPRSASIPPLHGVDRRRKAIVDVAENDAANGQGRQRAPRRRAVPW